MRKQDIQTVLDALRLGVYISTASEDNTATFVDAIAILQAALAEPSEPYAWAYTSVQSGFKQLQSYPPEHFAEWDDMEMWHVTPLFTHPASKLAPLSELTDEEIYAAIAKLYGEEETAKMAFTRRVNEYKSVLAAAREKCRG